MNPWPVDAEVAEVHLPRPGHADLAGMQKFGYTDVRNVLERACARETAARVAAGALAKAFLRALGRGGALARDPHRHACAAPGARRRWRAGDFEGVDESPVRSLDAGASEAMVAEIDAARKANESLGGVFEVIAFGLVPGIGSHVSWEERLDGRLAQAIMSIQAMKGVGIGDGFALAERVGSQAHDEIFWSDERGYYRETNRAGGIEGGMTTGDPLVVVGRDEAAAHAHQAAALGRHRDEGARPGAARAHRLLHRARRRRGGRGDGGAGARAPPTARSSAATTSTTRGPRCARTRSASAGGAHSGALVLVGFMGAGKSTGARSLAAELGAEPLDSDRELEQRLGEPVESFFDSEGEHGVPRARGGAGARAARAAGRAGDRARRRRARLRARARGARARTPWCTSRSSPTRPGGARPARAGRSPATAAASTQLHGDRARALRVGGRRDAAARRPRRAAARAARRCARCETRPAGTRLVWASAASGEYPVFLGRGLIAAGLLPPARRAPARRHRRERGARAAVRGRRADRRDGRARSTSRSTRPRSCCARLARAGRRARRPRGGGRRRRGGRPGRLLRRDLPARHPPRPGADHARGPGRLRLRRARPAWTCPRARTTRAPTTSRRRCSATRRRSSTLPPEELAAGYAEVVKTALIAGGPLWARVRQGGELDADVILGCVRTKLAVVAEDERDAGRRQVLNLGHTVGHAIEAATGYARYRHGEAVAIGLLAALRLSGRDALRDRGGRAARGARAAADASRRLASTTCSS